MNFKNLNLNIKNTLLSAIFAAGLSTGVYSQDVSSQALEQENSKFNNQTYNISLDEQNYAVGFEGLEQILTNYDDTSFSLNVPKLSDYEKSLDIPISLILNNRDVYSTNLSNLEVVDEDNVSKITSNLSYDILENGMNHLELSTQLGNQNYNVEFDIFKVDSELRILNNVSNVEEFSYENYSQVFESQDTYLDDYTNNSTVSVARVDDNFYALKNLDLNINGQEINLQVGRLVTNEQYNSLVDLVSSNDDVVIDSLYLPEQPESDNNLDNLDLATPELPAQSLNEDERLEERLEASEATVSNLENQESVENNSEVLENDNLEVNRDYQSSRNIFNINFGYDPTFSFLGKIGDNFSGLQQILSLYGDLEVQKNFDLNGFILGFDADVSGGYQTGQQQNNSGNAISEYQGFRANGQAILNAGMTVGNSAVFLRGGADYFLTRGLSNDLTLTQEQIQLLEDAGYDYQGFIGSQLESLNIVAGIGIENEKGYLIGDVSFPLNSLLGQQYLGRQTFEGDIDDVGKLSRIDVNLNAGYFFTPNFSLENQFRIRNLHFESTQEDSDYNTDKLILSNELMTNYRINLGSSANLNLRAGALVNFENVSGNLDGRVLSAYQIYPKIEIGFGLGNNN